MSFLPIQILATLLT